MNNIEEDYKLFQLVKRDPINSCKDLSKNMIGKKRGIFYFTELFRIDFENKMSDFERLKEERGQDKKRIKELEEENENKENKIWQLKETIQNLENECISLHELIDEEM